MRFSGLFSLLLLLASFIIHNSETTYAAQSKTETLRLEISTNKERFRLGEDIIIKVLLTNHGDRSIKVFNLLYRLDLLGIAAVDPDGKEVRAIYNNLDYGGDYYGGNLALLHPNCFVGSLFNLRKQCSDEEEVRYILNKKGVYRISASYSVPQHIFKDLVKSLGGNIWMGTLESNEVKILLI